MKRGKVRKSSSRQPKGTILKTKMRRRTEVNDTIVENQKGNGKTKSATTMTRDAETQGTSGEGRTAAPKTKVTGREAVKAPLQGKATRTRRSRSSETRRKITMKEEITARAKEVVTDLTRPGKGTTEAEMPRMMIVIKLREPDMK